MITRSQDRPCSLYWILHTHCIPLYYIIADLFRVSNLLLWIDCSTSVLLIQQKKRVFLSFVDHRVYYSQIKSHSANLLLNSNPTRPNLRKSVENWVSSRCSPAGAETGARGVLCKRRSTGLGNFSPSYQTEKLSVRDHKSAPLAAPSCTRRPNHM